MPEFGANMAFPVDLKCYDFRMKSVAQRIREIEGWDELPPIDPGYVLFLNKQEEAWSISVQSNQRR